MALAALAVGLPLLAVFALAAHFWSTAGELGDYRPAEPSRLYAAPLVLRVGAAVDARALGTDLRSLGYRPAPGEPTSGEYVLGAGELRLALRARADDEVLAATNLEARFAGGRLLSLSSGGRDLGPRGAVSLGRPLLYTYYDAELRECRPVRLADLPPHVVDAVLAAEDSSFFRHTGVAPSGILRAAWEDLRAREIRQGGSTITQQLVKNLFLGPQRTVARKVREAVLAVLVDARFGKRRILEAYLNEVYWGSAGGANLHGIGAAARAYFGKEPAELTLAEAATLAGMIQSPADYSPLTAPAAAQARRDRVLRRMARRHFVPRAEAAAARREPLVVRPLPVAGRRAPWFAVAMATEARQRFDVERLAGTGHHLLSTLSSTDQAVAEQVVAAGLDDLERTREGGARRAPLQAALVSLEPESGRILAWVGGRDWRRSEFDRVAQARRQAGSTFKPIVYATALMDGRLEPWELLRDSPILVRTDRRMWRPQNYDRTFHGDVTARQALEQSLNIPAVRVAVRAGLPRVVAVAHSMGIASALSPFPSLALGACEVTPLELAIVYSTLGASGRRPAPWGLEAVLGGDGEALVAPAPPLPERVLTAEAAYTVTSILRGVLDHGTGAGARAYGIRPGVLAGKTGTTDDRRDNWFAGYSAERVTVVWVGYDGNQPTRLSGSRGALPLWSRYEARLEPAGGYQSVAAPPGFIGVDIDPTSGLLASPLCGQRVREEMPAWQVPLRSCADQTLQPPLAALGTLPPGTAGEPGQGLAEFIARSAPDPAPVRLHDDVTRMFGQGTEVRVERRGELDSSTSGADSGADEPRPPGVELVSPRPQPPAAPPSSPN
ncbi:MAG TPA: transglycosylase domain-containing protein [Thermoanaerobaculia bacterium]|jgi:penicillin-binding protein 1B|nr:transglycosylase domain-containing protein [Thermoanaerobaculia bacterium]